MYNLILLLCFLSILIVVGVAVDWISDKLYWIGYIILYDYGLYGYQSTGVVINITILDLTTKVQKTVINEHVIVTPSYYYYLYDIEDVSNSILHIVVDPLTRYISVLLLISIIMDITEHVYIYSTYDNTKLM